MPTRQESFAAAEAKSTLAIAFGAKELRNDCKVGGALVTIVGKELVQKRGSGIGEKGFRAEEEIAVVGARLGVALGFIQRKASPIEGAMADLLHHGEKSPIKRVIVTVGAEKEVVTGEGSVVFDFLHMVEENIESSKS